MSVRVRDEELSSLLGFWGLEERELNGEIFLSSSSISSRGRRQKEVSLLQGTLPFPSSKFTPQSPNAAPAGILVCGDLNATVNQSESNSTVKRAQEWPGENFLWRNRMHATEVAGKGVTGDLKPRKISHEYDTKNIYTSNVTCANCAHYNDRRAHWCVECGTAVSASLSFSCVKFSEEKSLLLGNQLAQSPFDCSSDETYLSWSQCETLNSDGHQTSAPMAKSNSSVIGKVSSERDIYTQGHSIRANTSSSRIKRAFSVHSPVGCHDPSSVRYWDTSGVYMWRKPSSLKPVESSPSGKSTIVESGDQPNPGVTPYQTSARNFASTTYTGMLTSNSSCLLCLPAELLLSIFSYLSQSELATSMLVCHRIYVIASDPSLWNSVLVSKKRNVNDDMLLNVSRRKPHCVMLAHSYGSISNSTLHRSFRAMNALQELTIDACNFGPYTGDQLLISASIHCSQLSSVDIRWTHLSDKAFSLFSENCQRLRKIAVESVPQISINTFQLLMQRQRSRLTHVRIQGNMSFSIQDLMSRCVSEGIVCPNVIYFSSNHKLVEQDLEDIKMIFPML